MVDSEQIKQAYDAYETEDYITSKDILTQQIKAAKADWLARKLNLQQTSNPSEPE